MKRLALLFAIVLGFSMNINAQFDNILNTVKESAEKVVAGGDLSSALSSDEIGNGLKEALNEGVGKAVDFLSAEDGFYKSKFRIDLPADAKKVTTKLAMVPGWDGVEKTLEEKMNRAAESAVVKAKPIFISAITNMSFEDAMNILMGEQNSATTYLKKNTYNPLQAEFMPIIQTALDEVNARTYWKKAVGAYNQIPFITKQNPDLDKYVTQKALEAMFKLVTEKEKDIRKNTSSRKTDLLKKVFAKQDNQ